MDLTLHRKPVKYWYQTETLRKETTRTNCMASSVVCACQLTAIQYKTNAIRHQQAKLVISLLAKPMVNPQWSPSGPSYKPRYVRWQHVLHPLTHKTLLEFFNMGGSENVIVKNQTIQRSYLIHFFTGFVLSIFIL